MPTPFLSSEEYDERAHQLYNEGQYEEALRVLREGLALYPNAVALHIGVGYAQLAREEFAWARRSFEDALVLEPEHEDGLAGLGESLLKLGQDEAALRCPGSTSNPLEFGGGHDRKAGAASDAVMAWPPTRGNEIPPSAKVKGAVSTQTSEATGAI